MKKTLVLLWIVLTGLSAFAQTGSPRQRVSINDDWRFYRYEFDGSSDDLIYDVRPQITDSRDDRSADSRPTEAVSVEAEQSVLKSWILPSGNKYIKDPSKRHQRPTGDPGTNFPFVQPDFDDTSWQSVNLPHDWAINGPFLQGRASKVGGGMGRLPGPGVGWYRKKLEVPQADAGKTIFLEIDGAMSYAMVWLNGHLVGGWPYGYASWQLDLTPYIVAGRSNQLAIRVDNPFVSSRWYPGGGIYRNVWLTKVSPVHVAHWGTFVKTADVSSSSARIDVEVAIENNSTSRATIGAAVQIFELDRDGKKGKVAATIDLSLADIPGNGQSKVTGSATISAPRLWGPPPTQTPNRYVAVTTLRRQGTMVDQYETSFGIRSLQYDANKGILVNGEHIYIKGVNQHHDLGALGAAFNTRAAERQLEMLREAGCNAIRMAHNPPAPELLELTDRMGFLVIDEIFDVWERKKTPHDSHMVFGDWHEQDIRAFVRRDRNNPSVILWSYGNEVGEQYTDEAGAALAKHLGDIVKDEDPTRLTCVSMNYAKPNMPLPRVVDVLSLNYQGEGIRDAPEYAGLTGIRTSPLFPAFHKEFPYKVIISSENAAAVSTRGEYLFPVSEGISAPVRDGSGGDAKNAFVSAYELYTADFGSSADKVFASEDMHPYVAGGFVWSGWDYLGEPTPYYTSRSSYYGMIDLAGFKKDRFYLYQSRWRPELPMAHILPHWNWAGRNGEITPVHVFTSGDEAELFLNGKSLGRKKKQQYEYRLRWNDVRYSPGELKVIAYKNGKKWAEDIVGTTEPPSKLEGSADRSRIAGDGKDLSFVTVRISDKNGLTVPTSNNIIRFEIEGPGEIVATDNGNPGDFTVFSSHERNAFNGYCLVIVRAVRGMTGVIRLRAVSEGLKEVLVSIEAR